MKARERGKRRKKHNKSKEGERKREYDYHLSKVTCDMVSLLCEIGAGFDRGGDSSVSAKDSLDLSPVISVM